MRIYYYKITKKSIQKPHKEKKKGVQRKFLHSFGKYQYLRLVLYWKIKAGTLTISVIIPAPTQGVS